MTKIDPASEGWSVGLQGQRDFAMLVHDIRGALSGVIGGIALLDRIEVGAEARAQLDRVSAAAESLSFLIGDVIGEARVAPEAGQDTHHVELAGLLRFLNRRWSGEAGDKGLSFELEVGDRLPAGLQVDFLDLSRVLCNLIGNAIKFADDGTVRLAVRRDPSGGILFVLSDDGPGIAMAETGRVFEFGYRSTEEEKPGHGIGLHIAKTLTERMGGQITVTNRPEGGVEASFLLPRELCAGGSPPEPTREDGLPDLNGVRILLAEDNPTNQMVASQMLRSMNAEVEVAADGVEALARFEAVEFDLVIVDIEMPRKSGLDVIREIRARPDRRAGTPIVALTAYAMQEHRERIARAGASGLISKPIVSISTFGRALATLLEQRSAPAAPAPVAADAVIDRTIYDALAQTIGPEMMTELLARVVADLKAAEANLRRAADPLDPAALRAASHILISVAGAVGAVRLEARARKLNSAAHGDPGPDLTADLHDCLAEIGSALGFVRHQRTQC